MYFSEELAPWFREKPILTAPERTSQSDSPWVTSAPPGTGFVFVVQTGYWVPPTQTHQLLHFSLWQSANSAISLFNPPQQIHRPHPLLPKRCRETTLVWCKGNKVVERQQYFILFAAPRGCLCKGDLISNSNKAEKGPLLYGSILRRSPEMQQINKQKPF